jgi:bacteriocin biosynthesis cyclodehydratase domain-containing protein
MLKFPCVAPHLTAKHVLSEGLFFLSEHRSDVFRGNVFTSLLPLLDGFHSTELIADRLAPIYGEVEVLYAIELLERNKCIIERTTKIDRRLAAYWSASNAPPNKCNVTVINLSSYDSSTLLNILTAQGLRAPRQKSLNLVLVDDYLDDALSRLNAEFFRRKRTWMIAKPTGTVIWVGPIFSPKVTACWNCLAERLQLNRRVERFVERRVGERLAFPAAISPATCSLSASLIVNEISRWSPNSAEATKNASLMTFDTVARSTQWHAVIMRPQCPACGETHKEPHPLFLEVNEVEPKNRDCGLRNETSSSTYEVLKHHVSPITGVVSHLHPIETGSDSIHVYVAGQNYGTTAGTLGILNRTLRNRSSGKGANEVQAKTSALCESIERYASVYQGHEFHIVASKEELGDNAIHPNECMLFSDTQFRERDQRNVDGNPFAWIPRPLDPCEKLWWSPVWSLSNHQKRFLPTAYLYFHSEMLADPVGVNVCTCDSNGNAAGRSLSEAILQGLLELIERDAVALWWYPRTQLPGVDITTFSSGFLGACIQHHQSIARELWVLDATSDLGIPSFVAVSRKTVGPEQIVLGFGSHVDALIAVHRAVAEANQLLAGVEARLRVRDSFVDAATVWLARATTEKEGYLCPHPTIPQVTAQTYNKTKVNVSEALNQCLAGLRVAGLEAYAIDLTRPDVELNVVKVVCPGLRHFWTRFASGRLYDVPVTLGRAMRTPTEAELNPIAMFL